MLYVMIIYTYKLKGKRRDLTQFYDKIPDTDRKIQKATRQHKKRHQKLNNSNTNFRNSNPFKILKEICFNMICKHTKLLIISGCSFGTFGMNCFSNCSFAITLKYL